jgi:hypothetical protein
MGILKKYNLSTISLTVLVIGLVISTTTPYKIAAIIIMFFSIILNIIGITMKLKESKNKKGKF